MKLVFVHGWSVTNTDTYAKLPEALANLAPASLGLEIAHVWLGKYISFNDAVQMTDVVVGLDRALRDALAPDGGDLPEFSCITHSTGGPLVREWVDRYYGAEGLGNLPLRHLIMLAPANHGSPLAKLGKERVGRIKAWAQGVEPGAGILRWLALGSEGQWRLSDAWVDYPLPGGRFYPFVLAGQTIDTQFYDFLNSYLVEVGSDGVVRVAGANLNYTMLRLAETPEVVRNNQFKSRGPVKVSMLSLLEPLRRPQPSALGVLREASHSGDKYGIMFSVNDVNDAQKPVVQEILKCLRVDSAEAYEQRRQDLQDLTVETQTADTRSRGHRFANLVFRITDDCGNPVTDFDMFLLGGKKFDPSGLPKGFFIDRQLNTDSPNCLVYYVDCDTMLNLPDDGFGIRIVARPDSGPAYYQPVEYRTDGLTLKEALRPNETTYIDIRLIRHVHPNVFRFDPAKGPRSNFKNTRFP